jgi:hypothetical protein
MQLIIKVLLVITIFVLAFTFTSQSAITASDTTIQCTFDRQSQITLNAYYEKHPNVAHQWKLIKEYCGYTNETKTEYQKLTTK